MNVRTCCSRECDCRCLIVLLKQKKSSPAAGSLSIPHRSPAPESLLRRAESSTPILSNEAFSFSGKLLDGATTETITKNFSAARPLLHNMLVCATKRIFKGGTRVRRTRNAEETRDSEGGREDDRERECRCTKLTVLPLCLMFNVDFQDLPMDDARNGRDANEGRIRSKDGWSE